MMSLDDVYRKFPDEKACLEYIFQKKHPRPLFCTKCRRINSYHYNKMHKNFVCTCGQSSIYPRKNTMFDNSRAPIFRWFLMLYLMARTEGGIYSKDLAHMTGMSEANTLSMRRIVQEVMRDYLGDTVEMSEKKEALKKIKERTNYPRDEKAIELLIIESIFRERFWKEDSFELLLDLAIKSNKPNRK